MLLAAQSSRTPAAAVQQGISAYEHADYVTAFATLKPIAYASTGTPDPWATFYLARMTENGQGTEQDTLLACAMFQIATMQFRRLAINDWATSSERAERDACRSFFGPHANYVRHLWDFACRDGLPHTEIPFNGGGSVTIDMAGAEVEIGGTRQHSDPLSGICGHVSRPVHYKPIQVRRGSTQVIRHFLEFFVWQNGKDPTGEFHYHWSWLVGEVVGGEVKTLMLEVLIPGLRPPYPGRDLDPAIRNLVELRPGPDGVVEWVIKDQDRRGIIE